MGFDLLHIPTEKRYLCLNTLNQGWENFFNGRSKNKDQNRYLHDGSMTFMYIFLYKF